MKQKALLVCSFLTGCMVLAGCTAAKNDNTDSSGEGDESDGGPGTGGGGGEGEDDGSAADESTTGGDAPTTEGDENGDSSGGPDGEIMCDIHQQDCPEGEKCITWLNEPEQTFPEICVPV